MSFHDKWREHQAKLLRESTLDKISGMLQEVDDEYVDYVDDRFDRDEMPFDHLFGNQTAMRAIIPFGQSDESSDIGKFIKFLTDELGYERPDFSKGTVSKQVEITNKKTGEVIERTKTIKIGKLLQKELKIAENINKVLVSAVTKTKKGVNLLLKRKFLTDDNIWKHDTIATNYDNISQKDQTFKTGLKSDYNKMIEMCSEIYNSGYTNKGDVLKPWLMNLRSFTKFWNAKSEFYRTNPKEAYKQSNKYTIILSRHPVDVLRMSDWDDLSSCHSQPGKFGAGDYFRCAMEEAMGGAIAYVVKTDKLKKLISAGDVNFLQDEIFEDDDRDIDGLTPLSRLRIKRLDHRHEDYQLAIPEFRVYGKKFPTFQKTLRDWLWNKQKYLFEPEFEAEEIKLTDKGSTEFPNNWLNNFRHVGGTYNDNSPAILMSQFFGMRTMPHNAGSVSHPRHDYDIEAFVNDRGGRPEYEDAQENYRWLEQNLDNLDFVYDLNWNEDPEDLYATLSWSISIYVEIEFEEEIPLFDETGWKDDEEIVNSIIDAMNIYSDNIEVELEGDGVGISMSIEGEGGQYVHLPDEAAVREVINDIEDKINEADEIKERIENEFEEHLKAAIPNFAIWLKMKKELKENPFEHIDLLRFDAKKGGTFRIQINTNLDLPDVVKQDIGSRVPTKETTKILYQTFAKIVNGIAEKAARQTKLDFSGQMKLALPGKRSTYKPKLPMSKELVNLLLSRTDVSSSAPDAYGWANIRIKATNLEPVQQLAFLNALRIIDLNFEAFEDAINTALSAFYVKTVSPEYLKIRDQEQSDQSIAGTSRWSWTDSLRKAEEYASAARRARLRESKKRPIRIKIGRKR